MTSGSNPRSNVLKEVLDATRKEGLATGVYFSKPDWTSKDFWWPYYPPKDRNPTYDITKHPERWKRFVDYTQNQLNELTTEYGKVDILWLDGCWVLPKSKITEKVADILAVELEQSDQWKQKQIKEFKALASGYLI